MKIAVVGSSGYIAQFLIKRLETLDSITKVKKFDREGSDLSYKLELTQAEQFDYSQLDDVNYVVFTAAISGPDQCANHYEESYNINVTGTKYFIKQALKRKCRVLFFSSDAVFGDIKGRIYNEKSQTNPNTPYGEMKKTIEDEFSAYPNFKAIRLSYVVSEKDRFVTYCLNCIREGKTAEIFHPFYRNCITITDVMDTVAWMLENWDIYPESFFNVAGKELVSRLRIVDELNRCLDHKLKYTICQPNMHFYRNRPAITQMESLYLEKYPIFKNNTFTEKIQNELRGKI